MKRNPDNLTLLISPGQSLEHSHGLPMLTWVSEPEPSFRRLKKFFRPWRFVAKLLAVGLPCWFGAVIVAIGGWLAGMVAELAQSAMPLAVTGMSSAMYLMLMPLGILALWAGVVGLYDLADVVRNRSKAKAYERAVARLGEPDILTPDDLRSPRIREGLVTLGQFETLLASVERERKRISSLLRDSLHESRRLVHRSVLDLIQTERNIAEWSGRLGEDSTYRTKLEARRDQLASSYADILNQCLEATDRALSGADEDPADLKHSVEALLAACTRAMQRVELDGSQIDEEELLMYAAKAREAEAQSAREAGREAPDARLREG